MLGGKLAAGAGRHPDHQWNAELISRHVAHGRRSIEDLVEREQAEIDRHHLDDRPHAGHRRADAGAGKSGFRKRRIANPLGAEFGEQPVGSPHSSRRSGRRPRPSETRARRACSASRIACAPPRGRSSQSFRL